MIVVTSDSRDLRPFVVWRMECTWVLTMPVLRLRAELLCWLHMPVCRGHQRDDSDLRSGKVQPVRLVGVHQLQCGLHVPVQRCGLRVHVNVPNWAVLHRRLCELHQLQCRLRVSRSVGDCNTRCRHLRSWAVLAVRLGRVQQL